MRRSQPALYALVALFGVLGLGKKTAGFDTSIDSADPVTREFG